MRTVRRVSVATLVITFGLAGVAQALSLHIQRRLTVRGDVRISFSAPVLPEGGYYYAVAVLRPYRHYTRRSPPPCSTSSNMQRTDYGYPQANGIVQLALTPAASHTRHWCRGGSYEGAVYAVPHAPPCEKRYPCRSEPYEPPSPCWHAGGQVVCGLVALPEAWGYPQPLPAPIASGTKLLARFSLRFPDR